VGVDSTPDGLAMAAVAACAEPGRMPERRENSVLSGIAGEP